MMLLLLACAGAPEDSGRATPHTDSGQHTPCEPRDAFMDQDRDGWGGIAIETCREAEDIVEVGGDCDDHDPQIHPEAEETCDGLDEDCDGEVDEGLLVTSWLDGDGYGDPATEAITCEAQSGRVLEGCDCDDADPNANVDPLACPALECPEEGGVWQRGECD